MSANNIDLTEAIEAGRLARRAAYFDGRTADECAQAAVTAAAPLIEKAVREQVVRDLHEHARLLDALTITEQSQNVIILRQVRRSAVLTAAHIARGES